MNLNNLPNLHAGWNWKPCPGRSNWLVKPLLIGPASVDRYALMLSSPRSSLSVDLGRLSKSMKACLAKRSMEKVRWCNQHFWNNLTNIYLIIVGERDHSGQWVFGGVERGSGKCFLVPVKKRNAATLLPLIHEYILPGTTIYSDKWAAYNKIR